MTSNYDEYTRLRSHIERHLDRGTFDNSKLHAILAKLEEEDIKSSIDRILLPDSIHIQSKLFLSEVITTVYHRLPSTADSMHEIADFVESINDNTCVNAEALISYGHTNRLSDIFPLYDKNAIARGVINLLLNDSQYGVGKGETCFTLLAPGRITKSAVGDLLIDGKMFELKTTSHSPDKKISSGRFVDSDVTINTDTYFSIQQQTSQYIIKNLIEIGVYDNYRKEFEQKSGPNLGTFIHAVREIYQVVANASLVLFNLVLALFESIFQYIDVEGFVDQCLYDTPIDDVLQAYAVMSYRNYVNRKGSSCVLGGVIFLDIIDGNSHCVDPRAEEISNLIARTVSYPLTPRHIRNIYPQVYIKKE